VHGATAAPTHADGNEVGVAGAGVEAEGVMKDVWMETTETLLRVVDGGPRVTSCGCRNLRKNGSAAGATMMVFAEISRRGTASVVIRASSHMNGALARMMAPPVP